MAKLEELKKKIRPILKSYGIKKAGVFGSLARGEGDANDIDLLVKIDKKIDISGVSWTGMIRNGIGANNKVLNIMYV